MNLFAIFSKTGKGVQEASGKTSHLSRADRNVLKEIDGKTSLANISAKFDKLSADKFDALIQLLEKDGYIREVSSGAQPAAPAARPAAPAAKPASPKADDGDEVLDFTQAVKIPPKAPAAPAGPKPPPMDLAATARADSERKSKEPTFDFREREEAEAKAKAEADAKLRAAAQARAKAEAESNARAEAEAKAHAEAEARTRAEADAKVKAAREAAVRMATEAKARAEAESRAKAAELNAKLDVERKAREDAERRATEAAAVARREMEEKAKRDAEELRQRLEAEMKAKLDEERKAREEEDRKRHEEEDRKRAEEDRKRREEDERRRKEEEQRRAKEDAERKAREEEDRKRREADERQRKEDEARRAREDAERKARDEEERKKREEESRKRAQEEAERKARDEEERKKREEEGRKRAQEEAERKALEDTARRTRADEERKRAEAERKQREDDERRSKEEAERRAREEAERKARDEAERKARQEAEAKAKQEAEVKARAAEAAASLPRIEPVAPPPPPAAAAAGGGIGDSLLADLDSFGQREEEEQRAKEETERKAKEDAARKAAERKAKEEADQKRREEEERRRKAEEARQTEEEAEHKARAELERRVAEEAEVKRKAKDAAGARAAEEKAARAAASAAKGGDDINVSEDDLDADDLRHDQKVAAERARKVANEQPAAVVVPTTGRPKRFGKAAAIVLFVLLVGGIGVLHVMPMSTADYEKAAAEALGAPVKIASARLSLITGIEMRFEGVSIGDEVKIRQVRGSPELGSLFGARKAFSRLELEGLTVSQSQLADAVLGKVAGANFGVGRVVIKQAILDGPLKLPPLDVDAVLLSDGSVRSLALTGGDKLVAKLSPNGSDIAFEISAGSLELPVLPALSLSEFGMKGTANRQGVTSSEFDGRAFDGVISGTARIRWGANWAVDGEVRARGVKVAVFAPALVSEGKVDGRATYSMTGSVPAKLHEGAKMQGEFKIDKGVLGSFDLTRALQTGGAQTGGRTPFTELSGNGVYDKGVVQITNVAIAAGNMNAGASLTVDANGGLSGRVVADVKAATQTLRATLNLSGKLQDPVIRK